MKYEKEFLIQNISKEFFRKPKIDYKTKTKNIIGKYNKTKNKCFYFLIILFFLQFIFNIYFLNKNKKYTRNTPSTPFLSVTSNNYDEPKAKEIIEEIDVNILLPIQDKIEGIIEMKPNERKFLNGIIRKYKPKKVVEIGVAQGGSSVVILNAIKDIPNAKLYSIDNMKVWYKDYPRK